MQRGTLFHNLACHLLCGIVCAALLYLEREFGLSPVLVPVTSSQFVCSSILVGHGVDSDEYPISAFRS